ncbi:UNVERIFIED_CONTAM: hypothetical protein K2H54_002997 [Gekko kuhli]
MQHQDLPLATASPGPGQDCKERPGTLSLLFLPCPKVSPELAFLLGQKCGKVFPRHLIGGFPTIPEGTLQQRTWSPSFSLGLLTRPHSLHFLGFISPLSTCTLYRLVRVCLGLCTYYSEEASADPPSLECL